MKAADIIQNTEKPVPQEPQTRSNHIRLDPGFHFSLVPLATFLVLSCIIACVRHFQWSTVLLTLTALILWGTILRTRTYALKVQDRLIRLEERIRLQALLPQTMHGLIANLTVSQLVALRFASDTELAALAERAAKENLTNRQIKDSIQTWRPDYFRV